MHQLILHNFAVSPFSEKIRLVLGYKQLHWKWVTVPSILPKPDVVALTGGYRRTPLLQIGADIFCDTALICDVLERVAPSPTLYPRSSAGLARLLAQWADTTLFWAAIAGPRIAAHTNGGMKGEAVQAFIDDRAAMFVNMAKPRPPDAAAARATYLQRLSDTLGDKSFLLGDEPSIADFCAYHPIWFTRIPDPTSADMLRDLPMLRAWMERVRSFGHGTHQPMSSHEAVSIAASAAPAESGNRYLPDTGFRDDHGIALGSAVTITAESFGTERTSGELVAATDTHYSLRRTDPRAGTVHVHFPRAGFVLEKSAEGALHKAPPN